MVCLKIVGVDLEILVFVFFFFLFVWLGDFFWFLFVEFVLVLLFCLIVCWVRFIKCELEVCYEFVVEGLDVIVFGSSVSFGFMKLLIVLSFEVNGVWCNLS